MALNVIYIHKASEWQCNELKFSLRSVEKYLPYGNVYVAGDVPDWLTNVVHIECDELSNRYEDANHKWRRALDVLPKGEDYLLMHDDFFLLPNYKPVKYYKGKLANARVGNERSKLFNRMIDGTGKLNYAFHHPMPFTYDFEWPYDEPVSIMNGLGNIDDKWPKEEIKQDRKYHPNLLTEKFVKGLPCFSTYNETDVFKPFMLKLYPNKSIFEK